MKNNIIGALGLIGLTVVSGCGGDGGIGYVPPPPPPPATYTVGGKVLGLTGSGLVLQINGGDDLTVSAAGAFTFATGSATGTAYAVAVHTQPTNPTQTCAVTNASGTMGSSNVINVAVTCSTISVHFAYAANAGDNTVSGYSIDSATGALTAVGTSVPTGTSPYAIASTPDGQHLYVVNEVSNDISAFMVDAATGALTPISPLIAAGIDPKALAFDPAGGHLYVANYGSNDLSAYAVDASTGVLTPLKTATYATGSGPSAVLVDANGKFVYVSNSGGSNDISVFAITPGTGALTPVPGSPFAVYDPFPDPNTHPVPYSLALGAPGTFLYVATATSGGGSWIYEFSVNAVTGALTLAGGMYSGSSGGYIATDRTGSYLYVTNGLTVSGYRIDATNGVVPPAPVGSPVATGARAHSVTVDPSNQFIYIGNGSTANIPAYRLNATTGKLTAIPGSPFAAGHLPEFIAVR